MLGQSAKKSLREEVLEEILFYCSQVVNFSVKQAKESQEKGAGYHGERN
jgi:hypothetical protein